MAALPLVGGAIGGMAIGGLLQNWLIHKTGNRRWVRSGIGLVGNRAQDSDRRPERIPDDRAESHQEAGQEPGRKASFAIRL